MPNKRHTQMRPENPPMFGKMMQAAGREMKKNPPRIIAKTRRKKGKKAAERQRKAIMFAKARRGG